MFFIEIAIYESLIGPYLDYDNMIYDQLNDIRFSDKTKSFQYNAALTITRTI